MYFFNKWIVNQCLIMKITTLKQFYNKKDRIKGLPTY